MRRAQRASREHRGHEQAACHAGRAASARQLSESRDGDTGRRSFDIAPEWSSPVVVSAAPAVGRCSSDARTGLVQLDPLNPQPDGTSGATGVRRRGSVPDRIDAAGPGSAGLRGDVPGRGSRVADRCHRTVGSTTDSSCGRTRRPRGRPGYSADPHASAAFRLSLGGLHPHRPSPGHGSRGASASGTGFVSSLRHAPNGIRCGDREQSTCERSLRD